MSDRPGVSAWLHHGARSGIFSILCVCLAGFAVWCVGVWATLFLVGSCLGAWMWIRRTIFLKPYSSATHHVYTPSVLPGLGRLFYQGHVPILELEGSSHTKEGARNNGFAHGYLLAPQIRMAKRNFDFIIRTILRAPTPADVPHTLEAVKRNLLPTWLRELEGLCAGFDARMTELKQKDRLTLDNAILMHLVPDSKHFHPLKLNKVAAELVPGEMVSGACTCILQKDTTNGMILGRNMDWLAFGTGGESSLLIVWKTLGIASFTVPGLIGVVTGWNQHRLCVAMNVCPGDTPAVLPHGVPAIFYNRHVLQQSRHRSALTI
jgi:hypothetical protein